MVQIPVNSRHSPKTFLFNLALHADPCQLFVPRVFRSVTSNQAVCSHLRWIAAIRHFWCKFWHRVSNLSFFFCLRWCRFTTKRGLILQGNRKQHLSRKLFKSVSFRTMVELRTQSAEARCYNECFFMTEMEKDSGHPPLPHKHTPFPHTHTENTATPCCMWHI